MKLNYDYGELNTDGSVDATTNAGNIAKQTVNFSGLTNPFIQTYKYDSLDRITEAIEKVNGTQTWKQTFGYDIYGNRNSFYQIVGSTELTINSSTLPSVVATTNLFSGSQGFAYDKNGNITTDPANSGRNFVLDFRPFLNYERPINLSIAVIQRENMAYKATIVIDDLEHKLYELMPRVPSTSL